MDKRRDALAGAAKLALEIRPIAAEVGGGAVCTSGGVVCKPGIVTSVVETAEQLLDQRHLDAASLARLLSLAKEASERFAREEDVEVEWERIWSIEPILFDEALVELADESIREVCGTSHRLPSGPLHDAAEVARAGIPTVMLFVQSLRGLSHTKLEDTKPEHLELSVQALDRLATKTLDRLARMSTLFGEEHVTPVPGDRRRGRPHLARGLDDPPADDGRPQERQRESTTPLIFGLDGDNPVIVASKGGAPEHPGLVPEPRRRRRQVDVQIKGEKFRARARDAEGEERERLWTLMNGDLAALRRVPAKTDREIPVVVLERV